MTNIALLPVYCILMFQACVAEDPNSAAEMAVEIELIRFEINNDTFEMDYRITNTTNSDIWVCDMAGGGNWPFEIFLTEDEKTLLIRKRVDVPSSGIPHHTVLGVYKRIRPGEYLSDAIHREVPVDPFFLYSSSIQPTLTKKVRRVALEIGYYTEDLPELVRSIVTQAKDIGARSRDLEIDLPLQFIYFRGVHVYSNLFNFDSINKEPYETGRVLLPYSHQAFTGEKVLKLEINGVSIPYTGKKEHKSGTIWEQ